MQKINFQFHATCQEILIYFRNVSQEENLHMYLLRFTPYYYIYEVSPGDVVDYRAWREAILSKEQRYLKSYNEYITYSREKHGDLEILIGKETDDELVESAIGVVSKDPVNPTWKRIIRRFRSSLIKGAFVVSPNNSKQFYPNHWYTKGAQDAYEKGTKIRPIAGWNWYELRAEEEKK